MADDPQPPPPRRATDREGHVQVDIYRFLSDLADVAARTAVNERGLEELRRDVREGNAATALKFVALESHLARQDSHLATQDTELTHLRAITEAQHQEMLLKIEQAMKDTMNKAAADWEEKHGPLLDLYHAISGERQQRRIGQKKIARVGYAMIGSASGVLVVLVAGALNRAAGVPNNLYFIVVGVTVLVVLGLIVYAAINQPQASESIEPAAEHARIE